MKSLTREGMFVSDYVYTKYKAIYREAATLYNEINVKNPRKPDLRKTIEYRCWKNTVAEANNMPITPIPRQKKRALIHMKHRNIPINTADLPVADLSTTDISLTPPSPESPENPPENLLADVRLSGMTMQLNIPLILVPTPAPRTVQRPEEILTTPCEEITLDEGEQTGALDPTIFDEIPPEIMDKIIAELQEDPNLKDIMTDIENTINVEEELVGLTLDLPDPLEDDSIFW